METSAPGAPLGCLRHTCVRVLCSGRRRQPPHRRHRSGHGGVEPGAAGVTETGAVIYEDRENLAIALETAAILRPSGFRVVLHVPPRETSTRTTRRRQCSSGSTCRDLHGRRHERRLPHRVGPVPLLRVLRVLRGEEPPAGDPRPVRRALVHERPSSRASRSKRLSSNPLCSWPHQA